MSKTNDMPDVHFERDMGFWKELEAELGRGTGEGFDELLTIEGVLCDSYLVVNLESPLARGYKYLIARARYLNSSASYYEVTLTNDGHAYDQFREEWESALEEGDDVC